MRRLRNKKLRAQLYLNFNGKCAICESDLYNWHADHIIPFRLTQRTEFVNMQPLCSKCNLQKGGKVSGVKNRSYFESLNLGRYVDISPFRIGQKGAFNCIVEKIIDHSPTVSIVLPTRYGKSDIIRSSAIELVERGVVSGCLLAAPCKFLRDQLTNKAKVKEMLERYSISSNRPITYDILDNFRLPIFQNEEHFVALTTQMLANNADQICNYIRQIVDKTGKKFLVYIDESHSQSDSNTWGAVVPKITEAGGAVVLCTATPFRDDGKRIPGFKCYIESERVSTRTVPRKHETDEGKYWSDTYQTIMSDVRLEADYDYSFQSAWAEGNVICKISRRDFDVVVKIPKSDKTEDTKEIKISEMTDTECRKYLGTVTRDPKVISSGVAHLIDRLKEYRLHEPTAQAIIFCGNDLNEEDDGHAKKIATEINCQTTDFKVVIATSKQENADDLIKKFANGNGDILIVKQMASLGLDISSIKIALDLSAVRTVAAFIQRIMRTATIWGKNKVSHLIIPSDVSSTALWFGFIEGNGGNIVISDSTKINSIEKDKEDKDSNSKYMEVIRTEGPSLSDTTGSSDFSSDDYENYARPYLLKYPQLQSIFTDQDIISFVKDCSNGNLGATKTLPVSRDIAEERTLFKKQIEKITGDIATARFDYKSQKKEWIKARVTAYNNAKIAADVNLKTKMDKITNVTKLEKMKNYLVNELSKLPVNS